jgi:hypothetical protein
MRYVLVLISFVALVGCGDAGPSDTELAWRGSIDTLEGGTVHVRNPASPVWDSTAVWTLKEELRIGSIEGPEQEIFGSIAAVSTDRSGNIYVLESQAQEIRVFTQDGTYRLTIGRKGSGPGELEGAFGLAWDDQGRLWVPDARNVRYVVFDSLGNLLMEYRRPLSPVYPFLGGFDESGRLVDLTASASPQQLDLIPVSFDPELETFEYWAPVIHSAYFGVPMVRLNRSVPTLSENVGGRHFADSRAPLRSCATVRLGTRGGHGGARRVPDPSRSASDTYPRTGFQPYGAR